MEKVIFLLLIPLLGIYANESELEKNCLKCHEQNQLPSKLIYKRYLLKYSTPTNIKNAMFNYIKNPDPKNSIMPPQFFLKFEIKKRLDLDDETLKRDIELFIKKYDIKKRLK